MPLGVETHHTRPLYGSHDRAVGLLPMIPF